MKWVIILKNEILGRRHLTTEENMEWHMNEVETGKCLIHGPKNNLCMSWDSTDCKVTGHRLDDLVLFQTGAEFCLSIMANVALIKSPLQCCNVFFLLGGSVKLKSPLGSRMRWVSPPIPLCYFIPWCLGTWQTLPFAYKLCISLIHHYSNLFYIS